MGHMVRPVDALGVSSFVHFVGYKMCAHVGGHVMWHAMVIDKVFCTSINGGTDRSTVGSGEFIPRICVCSLFFLYTLFYLFIYWLHLAACGILVP